ncbi:MAG: DUF2971 domain-containing protein [Acidimicrobiales bacterium]
MTESSPSHPQPEKPAEWFQRSVKFLMAWVNTFTALMPAPPTSLYHYTDAHSLTGIAASRELWATNAVFMNDQTEITHAASLLGRLIEEEGDSSSRRHDLGPDTAVSHLLQFLHNYVELYVVSFCADGDLLSQWRGYASAGGYAIEFDGPSLLGLGLGQLYLTKVIYDEDVQLRQLRDLLDSWRTALASVRCSEHEWFKAAAIFAQAFGRLAISFKSRAFAEESEWRLFHSRLRLPETLPDEHLAIDFRVRRDLVVPFIRLRPIEPEDVSGVHRLPIKSIRVGPNPYPALAASGVWHLINERGLGTGVKVLSSSAPLRR